MKKTIITETFKQYTCKCGERLSSKTEEKEFKYNYEYKDFIREMKKEYIVIEKEDVVRLERIDHLQGKCEDCKKIDIRLQNARKYKHLEKKYIVGIEDIFSTNATHFHIMVSEYCTGCNTNKGMLHSSHIFNIDEFKNKVLELGILEESKVRLTIEEHLSRESDYTEITKSLYVECYKDGYKEDPYGYCSDCVEQDDIAIMQSTPDEIDKAIKDAERLGITIHAAIKMNKDFKDNTEYFETNYSDCY